MMGQPLGFLFIEHLPVSSVFVWEIGLGGLRLFWVNRNATNEVSVAVSRAWYVLPSGSKDGSFRIVSVKDDR